MNPAQALPSVTPAYRAARQEVLAAAYAAHDAAVATGLILDRKALVDSFIGRAGFPSRPQLYRWIALVAGRGMTAAELCADRIGATQRQTDARVRAPAMKMGEGSDFPQGQIDSPSRKDIALELKIIDGELRIRDIDLARRLRLALLRYTDHVTR